MSDEALDELERDESGSQTESLTNEGDNLGADNQLSTVSSERKSSPDRNKKPSNLPSLIASKISELEKESTRDGEDEKEIARAVKAEHRKLSTLVSETDTEIDKVTLLQRKYTSLFQDMQRLEREHARQRIKSEKSLRESTTAKIEFNKAVNMKHKLETLCRELQKENKRVKEDSKRLAQSEQQKRVELNNKFETTIFEIKTKMDEDSGLTGKRRLDDNDLKVKFKSFLEQYEIREKHFHNSLRVKELEIRLNQAQAEKSQKTSDLNEQRAKTLHAQVSTFSETESELRSQLNIYVEKFKQVEDTLNNSNDLFLNFRKEMETMTRKTKKLEKENALIRSKCDTANKNILEMAEERAKYRKEIDALKQKSVKLENLCRALQNERSKYSHANVDDKRDRKTNRGTTSEDDNNADKLPSPESASAILNNGRFDECPEDECSETSFEIEQSLTQENGNTSSNNVILGFLKVTEEEEGYIREKRLAQGQELHSNPDRDDDGYLAISAQEKEFIGAIRNAKGAHLKTHQAAVSGPRAISKSSVAEIAGKFNLFSKVFSGSAPTFDSSLAERTFTPEEKRLYDEAAARLSAMTQKFVGRDNVRTGGATTDAHTRQLETFKKQMPPEKLKDFSIQYDQMLLACRSLVTSPDTMPQTYEALMTSMAILLSENDLASLKSLYEQSRSSR